MATRIPSLTAGLRAGDIGVYAAEFVADFLGVGSRATES